MKNPISVNRSAGGETAWPAATPLLRAALLLAAAAGIASCGGDGSTEPVPPPPPPPPAPVAPQQVGTIPNQTIATGQTTTLDVVSYFNDPDGGALTYTVSSSAAGVVSVSMSASTLTLVGVADGLATVTVTATDPDGLSAAQGFQVTVETPNRAPEAVGTIPAQTLTTGQTETVDVTSYFSDADSDALTYTASSSAAGVVSVSVSANTLTLVGVADGTATVTVTATDPNGLTAVQSVAVTVRTSDRNILRILYETTGGPNWIRSDNWLSDAPLNEWHGVTANGSGRVTTLRLLGNNLQGSLPRELGGLSELDSLNISADEGLEGTVPAELGNLAKLNFLSLTRNGLSGRIPAELGQLAELSVLALGGNELTGSIPLSITHLRGLTELYLWGNRLTGEIPGELGRLTQLRILELGSNGATASSGMAAKVAANEASDALSDATFPALVAESFTGEGQTHGRKSGATGLTGEIPTELGSLANLERLSLHRNELSGAIPSQIGNLTNLEELSLFANALSGNLPTSFLQLTRLRLFDIAPNALLECPGPEFRTWLNGIADQDADELIACDHGDSIETATSVAIGDTVPGVLTSGDEDFFEITVPRDGFPLSAFTEGNTDTYGHLLDRDGSEITSNDDAGAGLNFHITRELDAGTYYLRVRGTFLRPTGSYSLIVEEGEADDPGDFDLDDDNAEPGGITYAASGRFYVTDWIDDKVYAYDASGARVADHDFDLIVTGIADAITYANDRFYVLYWDRHKVYAYTASGARAAVFDFDLDADNRKSSGGMTYANGHFYVTDHEDRKVYAYDASGRRAADHDFDLVNVPSGGIKYARDRFYVASAFGKKVYAYDASGARAAALDFDLDADNDDANGIAYANDRFYVVNGWLGTDNKVFAYDAAGHASMIADGFAEPPGGVVGGRAESGWLQALERRAVEADREQKVEERRAAGSLDGHRPAMEIQEATKRLRNKIEALRSKQRGRLGRSGGYYD